MVRITALALVAAIVSAGAAGSASAQAYMGIGAGQSRADLDCSGTTRCDKTGNAYKLFGGYMFMPGLGVEGAYYDQGKATVEALDPGLGAVKGEFKGYGFAAFAVVSVPLEPVLLFAKLGAVSAKIKLDATSSVFGGAGTSERHTNAAWGLGAGYAFDKSWVGRVEYERVRVKFLDEKVNVGLWTVSAVYRF